MIRKAKWSNVVYVVLNAELTYLAKMELGVVPSLESRLGRSTGRLLMSPLPRSCRSPEGLRSAFEVFTAGHTIERQASTDLESTP